MFTSITQRQMNYYSSYFSREIETQLKVKIALNFIIFYLMQAATRTCYKMIFYLDNLKKKLSVF